jgi:hypothetical protein
MGEKLRIVCRECGNEITPYEYNSMNGEMWFLNGDLYGEMVCRCDCGHHNCVTIKIEKAQVLEVCDNA